jgi:hypothetical protein
MFIFKILNGNIFWEIFGILIGLILGILILFYYSIVFILLLFGKLFLPKKKLFGKNIFIILIPNLYGFFYLNTGEE